jgi:tetratricopeptide (TPR) repeat protein
MGIFFMEDNMMTEFLRMLHEEEKMYYISEHTHVDRHDLYHDYLDNGVKQFNANGIRVVNTADIWIHMYTKAIEINPNDAELYYKRASYYEIRDKQDEAIADYSEAIRLRPDFTDVYLKRSLCYKKKGLKDEAISDFNTIIELSPDYAVGLPLLYGFITKTVAVDII